MKRNTVLFSLTVVLAAIFAVGATQVNLLTKAAVGDWAEYSVTVQNETIPLLSVKDQKQWKTVSVVGNGMVRIDNYIMMGDQRTGGLGSMASLNKPFEPVLGLAGATVTVTSESAETLTAAGKSLACTKIVRKISQPLDEAKIQGKWEGTSTIWICPDVPVGGLVKMENRYEQQLTASSQPNKIIETWVLTDFGLKNWKE
jgi:hypothetical protein